MGYSFQKFGFIIVKDTRKLFCKYWSNPADQFITKLKMFLSVNQEKTIKLSEILSIKPGTVCGLLNSHGV